MKKTIMILTATFALAACGKENAGTTVQEGTIELNLSSDIDFVTKAAAAITPEQKATYKITVSEGSAVKYGPETVAAFEAAAPKFAAGKTYTVKVENVTEAESEQNNGQAWINGTATVNVSAASNPAAVACAPKNAKVTFAKAEGFDDVFESASITLSSDGDTASGRTVSVIPSASHDSADAAYFGVGTLTCKISAKTASSLGGESKDFTSNFTLTAAQWSKITLSATADGSLSVTISVDTAFGEKEESIVLNPYM